MKKINFKKNVSIAFIAYISIGVMSCNNSKEQQADTKTSDAGLIFPKGKKVANNNFAGTVWLNNLVLDDSINKNAVGSVTFEPGARTKWHKHPAGQIILAIDGIGYYQEIGKEKIIIRKGDVVRCPPDTPHWHGASPETKFVQIAITGREKGETIWLEQVNEEQYNSKVAKY
ncbi:Cupin [Flavobacterium sp. 9R]|uniref:cupin domain-containing protein n=1 Tax=Flavobacterium sp. 9R TaxID=2653143 RepID=UPI0012F1DE34|nr:cupin domain-containing protein [Flavobacterium sp. 9R]VXB90977.1 Cupin [Flavobacterium sp. 9R]